MHCINEIGKQILYKTIYNYCLAKMISREYLQLNIISEIMPNKKVSIKRFACI